MPAEIIKIDAKTYSKDVLLKAAKVLAEGGLVAFPTETVYGLAANANIPAAVKKLYAVKQSPENRPFTYHLALADDIYYYIADIPRLAIRLMKAFWPGPLTMVLSNSKKEWVGLRVPDHLIAQDLIRLSRASIIASSANIADQEAPADAQTIMKTLGDKIDLIIDAGPTKTGVSSTVIKITGDKSFEILREGLITEDNIRRFTYRMIVFVCSGNTCRSPMAMGLFRKMIADKLKIPMMDLNAKGYNVISAGTSATFNSPASLTAIEVMNEIGVDIRDHLSQPVTLSLIDEADEIYVMTQGHLTTLREWAPQASDRIKMLNPDGLNIGDPIGEGREGYLRALEQIRKGLKRINI